MSICQLFQKLKAFGEIPNAALSSGSHYLFKILNLYETPHSAFHLKVWSIALGATMPSGPKGEPLGSMCLGGKPHVGHNDLGLIDKQWTEGAVLALTE